MIEIKRDGEGVLVNIVTAGYTFTFRHFCGAGNAAYAELLATSARRSLWEEVRSARAEAYTEGFRDAKAKRVKQDWFGGGL